MSAGQHESESQISTELSVGTCAEFRSQGLFATIKQGVAVKAGRKSFRVVRISRADWLRSVTIWSGLLESRRSRGCTHCRFLPPVTLLERTPGVANTRGSRCEVY